MMGELPQNTSTSVTNMAEYLAPELIQRHFPQRFEELPPAIFLEHYVEERTPAGRLGRKSTRGRLSFHSWAPRRVGLLLGLDRRLEPGDRLSLRDLLYGLMLPSGNDAARAIAVRAGDRTFVAPMRQAPSWGSMEGMAHAIVYEADVMGDYSLPAGRLASVTVPTLVLDGGQAAWISHAADAVAAALPDARRRTLEGQPHNVAADAVAPALVEFFAKELS